MDKLDTLLEVLMQDTIISRLSLKPEEIESALDRRDEQPFDQTWARVFRDVEEIKGSWQDAEACVGQLRELAYMQAIERWGSADLSAYISDDFGLIADALAINYQNPLLNELLHMYLTLRFPSGTLVERRGQLGELVAKCQPVARHQAERVPPTSLLNWEVSL